MLPIYKEIRITLLCSDFWSKFYLLYISYGNETGIKLYPVTHCNNVTYSILFVGGLIMINLLLNLCYPCAKPQADS